MSPRQPLVLRRLCGSACFAAALSQAIYCADPFPACPGRGQHRDPDPGHAPRGADRPLVPPRRGRRRGAASTRTFARDWSPLPDENRFLVYQARMTWTAAAFAASSPRPHRDEYLGYARHGIEYLDRVMRDGESRRVPLDPRPRRQVDPRLGDEKHVYGTAFVLYAASKVHEVTRDELALKVARDAFDWLEAHAHDARARRLLRGDPPRRDADPDLGRARPDRQADRPAGRLLRLQVDELAHPPAGGARRVLPGREDARSSGNGCARSARDRPRPDRRRARGAQPVPDPRLAGDPGPRLVRPRHRDGLPARRGRRGPGHRPTTRRPGTWPGGWSTTPSTGAGTRSTAGSTTRASRSPARPSTRTKVWWTAGRGAERPAADAPEVRRPDRPLRPGVPQAVGLHREAPARPRATAAGTARRPARAS